MAKKARVKHQIHKWVNSMWYGQNKMSNVFLPLSGVFSTALKLDSGSKLNQKSNFQCPSLLWEILLWVAPVKRPW